SVELYSGSTAKRQGLMHSLAFTLSVNLITLLLVIGVYLMRDRLPNFLIVPEIVLTLTMICVSLLLTGTFLFAKKDGINKVFSLCNQFSFLSGAVSLVILTAIFTNGWKIDGSAQFAAIFAASSFHKSGDINAAAW